MKQSLKGNAAEGAEQWFLYECRSSALLSRAGRSLGLRRPANIRLSPGVPRRLRPNPKPFVILNEVKNLFPCEPKAACGLCRARRRKTNEVQSNICIVSIQILRRSAPQNDKTGRTAIRTTRWNQTIHYSQTPRQTGICNWRQRGVENGNGCSDCSRVCQLQVQAEFIKAGFSRASRSPALRRLAKLAPRASARKQHSADRSRACELTTCALSEQSVRSLRSTPGESRSGEPPRRKAAARATLRVAKNNLRKTTANNASLRIAKPQNDKKRRSNNRPQTTIPYQSSCAMTPSADC